jgi:hypothetical protein
MVDQSSLQAALPAPLRPKTLQAARMRLNRLLPRLRKRGQGDMAMPDLQTFVENLSIVDKRGEVVSLIMNRSQEIVFEKLLACREQKRPARFICLKARQLGISTLIEAFLFALITLYANRSALVVAHSVHASQGLFSMTRRFYRGLPAHWRRPLSRNTVGCMEYRAPHSSRIQIDTASNQALGRGATIHYVHASEVAFWERPEEPILAINQAAPRRWDTLIFWESTANGVQNLFHRTWLAAQNGDSDMEPIFLSWKCFPEYSLPLAQGECLTLTEAEASYAQIHGLDASQTKWAIHTMKSQCHNSWDKFHQEYPVSPGLAFLFTGMPWFDPSVLAKMLNEVACDPLFVGRIDSSGKDALQPALLPDPSGPLAIWKHPEEGLSYALGMDVGEGVGADYTVIQVICQQTGDVAAMYRSNKVRPDVAAMDACLLAAYYHYGLLGIERNGPGLAALTVCERGDARSPLSQGYPNLYYHTLTDVRVPRETSRLGWLTTSITKQAMLARLAESVQTQALTIYSRSTLLSMQGFVWDADRRCFKQTYRGAGDRLTHDDEIMALAIAEEMRWRAAADRFMPPHVTERGF